jgi:prepilin-type N-terminal cleavage/methylation domain-containing protein
MKKRWLWRGFTLVELLVVIAIIGILVALLLPAIQAAREAGRRISCGNNIKQLVLGMHDYHDVHNSLPISFANNVKGNPYGEDSEAKSWMVGVLPFIEHKPLYDRILWRDNATVTPPLLTDVGPGRNDPDLPGGVFPHPSYPNSFVADTVIKAFLCPSDGDNGRGRLPGRANASDTIRAVNNYKACAGANWGWAQGQATEDWQPAPYPGSWNGLDEGNGIVCRNDGDRPQNYHDFAFITDGTSNTFAVGEAVPAWCTHTWWWHFNGTTASCGWPLNYRRPDVLNGTWTMEQYAWNWPENYTFHSRHPTGGQFGMNDGAVRFVVDSIDFTTYKRLATAAGGRPATVPQ